MTILLNAPPTTTPTAISITFPFVANALKSFRNFFMIQLNPPCFVLAAFIISLCGIFCQASAYNVVSDDNRGIKNGFFH